MAVSCLGAVFVAAQGKGGSTGKPWATAAMVIKAKLVGFTHVWSLSLLRLAVTFLGCSVLAFRVQQSLVTLAATLRKYVRVCVR